MMMINNSTHEFEPLLGKAALALWSDFPRDVQENLFETAVAGKVIIRNHLASYLHDHHPKTAHPAKPTQLAKKPANRKPPDDSAEVTDAIAVRVLK
jgi:hypothetical protein